MNIFSRSYCCFSLFYFSLIFYIYLLWNLSTLGYAVADVSVWMCFSYLYSYFSSWFHRGYPHTRTAEWLVNDWDRGCTPWFDCIQLPLSVERSVWNEWGVQSKCSHSSSHPWPFFLGPLLFVVVVPPVNVCGFSIIQGGLQSLSFSYTGSHFLAGLHMCRLRLQAEVRESWGLLHSFLYEFANDADTRTRHRIASSRSNEWHSF